MLPACHPQSRLSGSSRYRCPSSSHASIHSVRCSASAGQPRYKRDLLLDNVNDDAETTLRPYILSPLPEITDQQSSQSQALSDAAWVPDGGVLEPAVIEPLSGPCADFQASTYAEGCSPAQDGLYERNWAPPGSVDDEQWLEGQTSRSQSLSQQARIPAQSAGLRGLPGQDPRQDPISSYSGEGASEITAADPFAQGLDPGITSNHMQADFKYHSTSHQETPGTSAQACSGSWDEFGDTPGRRTGSQRPSPTVPSSAANSDARQRPQDASSSMDQPSWASRSTASDDPAFADSAGWDAGADWGQGQIISDWDGYPASRGPSQAVNSTGPGWQDSPLGPMGQQQSGSSSSEAPGFEGRDATRIYADAGRQSAGGRAWDNGNVDEQASGASSSSAAGFVPSDITLLARMDAVRGGYMSHDLPVGMYVIVPCVQGHTGLPALVQMHTALLTSSVCVPASVHTYILSLSCWGHNRCG